MEIDVDSIVATAARTDTCVVLVPSTGDFERLIAMRLPTAHPRLTSSS